MRVPLPEELQELVRDVVHDLQTTAGGFEAGCGRPRGLSSSLGRAAAAPPTSGRILRLPQRETPALIHRHRGYLVHLDIPARLVVVGHPVRLRRLRLSTTPVAADSSPVLRSGAAPAPLLMAPAEPVTTRVAHTLLALPTRAAVADRAQVPATIQSIAAAHGAPASPRLRIGRAPHPQIDPDEVAP